MENFNQKDKASFFTPATAAMAVATREEDTDSLRALIKPGPVFYFCLWD